MNTWNNLLRSTLLACLVLFSASALWAQSQVSRYKESTFTSTWSSISGSGNYVDWGDDDVTSISLPFDFNYDSTTYSAGSSINLCTNGWLSFSASDPNYPYNRFGTADFTNTMAFWGGDGAVNDGIYYEVQGTAPNRVLVMEWTDFSWWDWSVFDNDDNTYWTSVQVKFYETSNVIEYVYKDHSKDMNTVWYGEGAKIGIEGSSASDIKWSTYTSTTTTPSTDIRWTPAPLPPPPSRLSVTPKILDFGSLNAGFSSTQCVTLKDVGPGTLIINSTGITGNPDFSIASGPAVLDSFHTNESTTLCVTFSPLASGTRTATLTVVTNGKDSGTQNIVLTGRGVAPDINVPVTDILRKVKVMVGDSLTVPVAVQSTGTGPLTITGWSVTGLNPDQYVVSKYPTDPIPAGAWDTVYITYKPTFEGKPDATVLINSNALNYPQVAIRTFGSGIIPRLVVTPSNLSFDSVNVGQQSCTNVTLTNPGSDTVAILRELKTSGDYDFTFTPLAGTDTLIAPGGQRTFNVCFTPLRNGLRTATIRFYSNIPSTFPDLRDTSQIVLNITGTGVPFGNLSFAGTAVDTAIVGIEHCVTDTISNTGSADITVSSTKIIGADSAEFSFSGLTLPVTIAAGQTQVVTYCLTPTERGLRQAALVLTGSSAGTPTSITLPLLGYGVQVCATSTPATAFTTKTPVGMTDTATITVTNCGDVATAYTAALPGNASMYSILGAATTATVAPGSTGTFQVTYTPTTIGANAANLTITGGTGVTPMTVALGGVGAGVNATATGTDAGTVAKGSCQDFTVTITNTGNVDWTPGDVSISGPNAGDYTFVSLNPTTIAAGGTATLTLKFCPTTTSTETATINFPNAAPTPLTPFSINVTGTGEVSGVTEVSHMAGFEIGQSYPNPMHGSADVAVTVPSDALVRIQLVDLTGHVVRSVLNQRLSAGFHTVAIDASGLPSGTYYYILTSGDVRLARQLVVTK